MTWLLALVLATGVATVQVAAWRVWPPAAAAAVSLATVGLVLCLGRLWQRHSAAVRELEKARAEHAAELEGVHAQWQGWSRSQSDATNKALSEWSDRLREVLNGQEPPKTQEYPGVDERVQEFLRKALQDVAEATADHQDAYEHALKTLAQRLQSGALRVQKEAAELVASRDLALVELGMRIDHQATHLSHLAQGVRILCGEWTGQQWRQTVPLTDVVRAASGRITEFRRVEVSGEPDMGVSPYAAEWLIHLVAELLANATTFSPPPASVGVQVELVQRGVVVQIDDRGLGMTESQLEKARRVVSGERVITLRDLDDPQTGLAVVGRIAHQFGIEVDLNRSPYGGLRVVVLVPHEILEPVEPADAVPPVREETPAVSAEIPEPTAVPAPAEPAEPSGPVPLRTAQQTTVGLPKRRSRRVPTASDGAPAAIRQDIPEADPAQAGAFLAGFINAGRDSSATGTEPSERD